MNSDIFDLMNEPNIFSQVRKLILDECDIILECRVCRNLFRSLPNFLAHKQTFCKNQFNHLADSGFSQFIQTSPTSYEFQYHLDDSLLDSCVDTQKEASPSPTIRSSIVGLSNEQKQEEKISRLHKILTRIAPEIENATRTPSALYSDIVMRKNRQSSRILTGDQTETNSSNVKKPEKVHIVWEPLSKVPPSNGVIFQKTVAFDPSNCDVSSVHTDNRQIAENDTAVLGPDGKIICVGDAQVVEKIVSKVIAQVEEIQDEKHRRETELKCPDCESYLMSLSIVLTLFRSGGFIERNLCVFQVLPYTPLRRPSECMFGQLIVVPRSTKKNKFCVSNLVLLRYTLPDRGFVYSVGYLMTAVLFLPVSHIFIITEAIAESKLLYEQNIADGNMNEHSGDSSSGDQRCTSPPAKKLKTETSYQSANNSSSTSSSSVSSNLNSDSKASSLPLVPPVKQTSVVFNSVSKRPRGRPRKNSMVQKKDGSYLDDHTSGRIPRSDSSDTINSAQAHDRGSLRQGKLIPRRSTIFTCIKCPQKFGTKAERSLHLGRCTGGISYAFPKRSRSPDMKKVGIQIRRDYVKEDGMKENETNARSPRKCGYPVVNGYIHKHISSSKLDWSRYSPAKSNTSSGPSTVYNNNNNSKPPEVKVNNPVNCMIANGNSFGNIGGGSNSSDVDAGMGDDEREDDDDYEDEDEEAVPVGGVPGANNCASDSSGDDGLPFDDEKLSSGQEIDVDTDKDSNITDSGVSTTSVLTKSSSSKSTSGEDEAAKTVSETASTELLGKDETIRHKNSVDVVPVLEPAPLL